MSASKQQVYYSEDGRTAIVEFQHGNTDYKSMGTVTFSADPIGTNFVFRLKSNSWDDDGFSILAEDMLAILNKLTGNERFPNRDTSMEDTQVIRTAGVPGLSHDGGPQR